MSEKMMCMGEPFFYEHSSCSDLTPTMFNWTRDSDETDTVVCIDNAIIGMFDSEELPERRFAWVSESPVVVPQVYEFVHENYEVLLDYYEAICTCDLELVDKHDRIHLVSSSSNLPWVKDFEIYEKTKNVSMVASNKTFTEGQQLRHTLAEKYEGHLDVMGSINGDRIGSSLFDKLEGYKDYRFTLVTENCKRDSTIYFTEKITDAFATGTIPVYWGTSKVYDYFNPDGIIELTDDFDITQLTPELYDEKLDAVKDNFERVKKLRMVDDEVYDVVQAYK
jgi:hypothetical protein